MEFLFTPLGMFFTIAGLIMLLFAISDPIRGLVLMIVYGIAATLASENMAVSGFGVGIILAALAPRAIAEAKTVIHRDQLRSPVDWMFGGVIAMAVIHFIVGILKGNQFRYLGGDFYHLMFEVTLPFFIVRVFVRDEQKIRRFVELATLAAGVLGALLLILLVTGWIRLIPGSGWEMAHTDFWRFRYSHHFPLNPLLLALGVTAIGSWGNKRGVWFVIGTLILFVVMCVSLKRAAWLAFLTVFVPLPLLLPPESRGRFIAAGILVTMVMVGLMIFNPSMFDPITQSAVASRAASFSGGTEEFGNRFEQAQLSLDLIARNPAGYGLGSELQTLQARPIHYVHNTFLHYALQAGVPTSIFILLIFVRTIVEGITLALRLPIGSSRGVALGCVLGLVAMLETGMTEATVNTYYFTIFCALIFSLSAIERRERAEVRRARIAASAGRVG